MTIISKVGTEFLVNTETAGNQSLSSITVLTGGGFVVTWKDNSGTLGDNSSSSIKAQVFSATGVKVGTEFLVNTATSGGQDQPSITSLANGGFVVTWVDYSGTLGDNSGTSIKAQLFSADGTRVGTEFLVNTQIARIQDNPSITSLAGGGFVVTWSDDSRTLGDSSGRSIKAQLFSADGTRVGTEFLVNTQTASSQVVPSITTLAGGGFVVTWLDESVIPGDSNGYNIKAQLFSADGTRVGSEFLVNTTTASFQFDPSITGLANGGFVVTWGDYRGTLGDSDGSASIKAQVFNATGVKVGNEFLVNTATTNGQDQPSITSLANGGFVVTWKDNSGTLGDNSSSSIKAQVFNATGVKVGNEFLVNTATTNGQDQPSITSLANGDFVITWNDPSGTLGDSAGSSIKAQVFSANVANAAPTITSNGGADTAAVSINENATAVTTVTAADASVTTTLTYSITGGADAARFSINAATGALSFTSAPNFEAPTDAGGNNVYDVIVQASDGTFTDTQAVAVTVGDMLWEQRGTEFLVNTETAGQQSYSSITALTGGGFVVTWQDSSGTLGDNSSDSIKAQLFSAAGDKVGPEFLVNTITASIQYDPSITGLVNGGFVVTWTDVSGTLGDNDERSIKAQVFSAAGVKVGNEFLVNTETTSDQLTPTITGLTGGGFVVTWEDSSRTLGDNSSSSIKAQLFSAAGVKVGNEFLVNTEKTNVQAQPTITGLTGGGFVVTWQDQSGTLGDNDGNSIKAQIFSAAGVKVGTEFLVNTETSGDQDSASITSLANGGFVVAWSDTSGTLGDSDSYSIKAQVFSAAGVKVGTEFLVNTQTADLQAYPAITSLANGGFVVTWADASGTLGDSDSYSIKAQVFSADGTRVGTEFLVNTQTESYQAVSSITSLANGDFVVTWLDYSGTLGDNSSSSIKAQIFREDIANAAPVISSNGGGATAAVSIAENDTVVASIQASDVDANTTLTYSIIGGADAARFSINAATGRLLLGATPNFEAPRDTGGNNVYDVVVQVSDGSLTDTQVLAVTVTNVNEAPVISSNGGGASASVSIAENGSAIATVQASDIDAGTTLAYSISGGADAALFSINAATGALTFKSGPNFEAPTDAGANNVYNVIVQTSDGALTDTQAIAVTVTNINEFAPIISSNGGGATAGVSIAENGSAVTTVKATDPDAGSAVSYAISGGADAALFSINTSTGALSFKSAPNFEAPTDTGANNVYDVIVQASDGALTNTQAIAVTVTNVSEFAPIISSNGGGDTALISVAENETAVTTVQATDADAATTLVYSISGGGDAELFSINAATGALSFKSAPDFEAPSNAGGRKVYDVVVQASDGTMTDMQVLAVTVANINEAPSFSAPSQSVSATAGTAKAITLAATDVDGHALTYTVASPGKGTATISGRTLTYTPALSASGPDSFVVTASDGKGGTATQTINATIAAVSSFRLAVPDGWTGSVGGNGTSASTGADGAAGAAGARLSLSGGALAPSQTAHVTISGQVTIIGTSSNDIVALDAGKPANLTFDASFNQGGDIIILDKDAASYSAVRSGSSILLTATNETLNIPVGTAGLTLRFTDGDRTMLFAGGAFKIGDQAIGTAATPLKPTVITYIDIGAASFSETISGDGAKVIFTNDPTKSAFVKITNFGSGDLIKVTGATDYIFTTGDLDGDGTADDLSISLSNPDTGIVNDIYVLNSVSPEAFVFDRATAVSAVGFNFIAFG